MNIYSKNRTGSYYYRKIYEDVHGKIPVDADGRTYEIHHIDGNTENNDISNLIAVSIHDHYEIHKAQGDSKACLAMSARMKITQEEKRRLASEANIGDRNPSYGSKWWNNGVTEIRSKIKPSGNEWIRGRFGLKSKILSTKNSNDTHPVGNKNPRYDHKIYQWYNTETHERISATRFDFRISLNINKSIVRELINGDRSSYKGWTIIH